MILNALQKNWANLWIAHAVFRFLFLSMLGIFHPFKYLIVFDLARLKKNTAQATFLGKIIYNRSLHTF